MRTLLMAVLVLVGSLALSGCVVDPPIDDPKDDVAATPALPFIPDVPDFDFSTIVDPDHGGHETGRLHTAAHGLDLVGHTGVGSILPPGVRGSITQIDVWNGFAVVAGMEQGPAFILVDITDPDSPKPVSYAPTVADGWTARFSKDGQYVFYGCQILGPPNSVYQGQLRGDCTDPTRVHGQTSNKAGVSVWDVSDKADPKFVHFLETAGSHNIQTQNINGTDYVFTAKTTILKFDRESMKLSLVAEVPGVHDSTVVRHPVTGDWLLYTGGGGGTFAIYNVNVPEAPEVVLEGGHYTEAIGWHDQVAFPTLVDGRALLALAGETGVNPNAGVPDMVAILDITDPANPVLLSKWQPPFVAKVPWVSYTFSVHEMAATPEGQLAISWYHAGAWIIDLSTKERQAAPPILAAYQPHAEINVIPSSFAQTPVPLVPFVWSVAWDQRGYLVVPDMHTGVHVLEPSYGLRPILDGGA